MNADVMENPVRFQPPPAKPSWWTSPEWIEHRTQLDDEITAAEVRGDVAAWKIACRRRIHYGADGDRPAQFTVSEAFLNAIRLHVNPDYPQDPTFGLQDETWKCAGIPVVVRT